VKNVINEAPWDRIARVILGAAMLYIGFAVMDGTWGTVVGIVGFIPLLTGLVGWCPLYALFRTGTSRDDRVQAKV
jgi:O-antigen/teichoic acid export membrane protein